MWEFDIGPISPDGNFFHSSRAMLASYFKLLYFINYLTLFILYLLLSSFSPRTSSLFSSYMSICMGSINQNFMSNGKHNFPDQLPSQL